MPNDQLQTAVLLLAAGASTRLGSPKQLVKIGEQFLLEKMVETALETPFRPVVVVLGAYFEKIKKSIAHLPVHILQNENWESGMGSSIACGIGFLEKHCPEKAGTLLMLCDQPFVTPAILKSLPAQAAAGGLPMAAARYGGTLGPPAFFAKNKFAELKKLRGAGGAKILFAQWPDQVAAVDFPPGKFDVDTPDDVEKLSG